MKTDEYHCNNCAKDFPYVKQLRENLKIDLLGTTYQQDKFKKHTEVSTEYPVASVFNNRSTSEYDNHYINALHSGIYAKDRYGRESLTFSAGHQTGITYENGKPVLQTDSVKAVCCSGKTHLYPISSTNYSTGHCESCGISIITSTQIVDRTL